MKKERKPRADKGVKRGPRGPRKDKGVKRGPRGPNKKKGITSNADNVDFSDLSNAAIFDSISKCRDVLKQLKEEVERRAKEYDVMRTTAATAVTDATAVVDSAAAPVPTAPVVEPAIK